MQHENTHAEAMHGEHAVAGEHAPGGDHDDATMHHRFNDASEWAEVFDDPARDAWQKPAELVAALGLSPGDTVADIGAGTGYLNAHLAEAVGAEGRVLARDVEASMVDHMVRRARSENTPQVQPGLAEFGDPKLPAGEVDLVLLLDTYHHISDRGAYFTALHEAMTEEGRLAVVDFKADPSVEMGPPVEHRLSAEKVQSELSAAGWTLAESPDLLPMQYLLIFERAEAE